MIHQSRLSLLNDKPVLKNRYVIYWMQQSQRVAFNHALEFAIDKANELNQPLVVFFGLTGSFPEANRRHYAFMLQGLSEVGQLLRDRGILFVLRPCLHPADALTGLAADASIVVTDRGYLRVQRLWREQAASKLSCQCWQVESDAIVPVETASVKEEFSAGTLRPKINALLTKYLLPVRQGAVKKDSLGLRLKSSDPLKINKLITELHIDSGVPEVRWLRGGPSAAEERLASFLVTKIDRYAESGNDPSQDFESHLSPWLHFGQISSLQIALETRRHRSGGADAFLEQLIVRRELAMNFTFYNMQYDTFECLPAWARRTLDAHAADRRQYLYSLKQLESAATHDPYWNAAQREMVHLGKMHGYMRMYWGKKIMEWSPSPQEAYRRALYLNNKYFIDGRDPNGYAGVAWCFGKHDRAWGERDVFGKVRYMNARGLERKFEIDAYIKNVDRRIGNELSDPDEKT